MLKPPPQLFRSNVLATSPGESKSKSCLIACVKAARNENLLGDTGLMMTFLG